MILLPNACYCSGKPEDTKKNFPSELAVNPSNWKTVKASTKKDWYIQYYFHDPLFKERYPRGKFIIIKGMNAAKSVDERRMLTLQIMRDELNALIVEGYNPITGHRIAPAVIESEISPFITWVEAVEIVYKKLKVKESTLTDLKSVCKYVGKAAKQLRFDQILIKDVRRKHVELCLEHLQKTRPLDKPPKGHAPITWGPASFNRYRSYLIKIFKELIKLEALENNPALPIEKQEEEPEQREILSNEETIKIDKHLKSNYYTFWRYMRIFFHSGGRTTELLAMQVKDVDLDNQKFTVTVTKGRKKRRVTHTITNIALPLWQEVLKDAVSDYFVFSEGLVPGETSINTSQIKRRWREHVKIKLGISADFYSLKHLNLDKITELLSVEDAAGAAGHTSTAMVKKHYAVREKERQFEKQHERLKKVQVLFAS